MIIDKIIKDKFQLQKILLHKKEQGDKIVFSNGCFDIIHAGHICYLEATKALGDCLVVGINSNASVRRLKGHHRPVIDIEHRLIMLAGLASVDYVIEFNEDTPLDLITHLTPDILVKGSDYTVDQIVGGQHVIKNGGSVQTIPLVEGLSTSDIIKKIHSI